jgi:hypothetical protein
MEAALMDLNSLETFGYKEVSSKMPDVAENK